MYPTSSKNLTVHMHNFTCVLMMLIFVLAKTSANDFSKSREAKALLATNWWGDRNASSDHCTWPHISCSEEGSVISIYFYGNDNEDLGDLRSFDFASFPNLEGLSINNCKLEGSIPEQIGLLSNLTYLSLSNNYLTGIVPDSFSNLICLENLNLFNNFLTGNLTVSFANLTHLENLDLSNNNFTGILPSSFGSMVNLTNLDLSGNQLKGSIPPALITNLHKLDTLDLSNNNLDGPIPSQLARLRNLAIVDFSQNQLRGSIPSYLDSMANLTNLTYLSFRGNLLTGKLPVSLTNLTQLENLDLSRNNFMGFIPPALGSMANLNVLDLSDNNLDGPIPSSFGNLSQLQFLNLAMNSISGPIPQDIAYLTNFNLGHLDLHHNRLVGAIHPEFWKLSSVSFLDLSSNKLSGNMSFSDPCSLLYLNLSRNRMGGVITSVCGCRNLESLDISGNYFVGEALNHCDFPYLLLLNQSQNHLTGEMIWSSNNLRSAKSACNEHKRRKQHLPRLTVFLPIIVGLCFLVVAYCFYSRKKATTKKLQPEITKHGDVFGVVALETIGGKHPGELLSYLNSSASQGTMLENILDKRLSYPTDRLIEKEILRVCHVALACILTDPKARPTMRDVSQELSR
ncbi:protein kinase-like domain, Leucine-rich repeat domain, L domain-like protein [Artemisia annua]|uniref:Protein kinase-like domain, Leucine-rich repeat domain, L domain-like protein n=1 Tax=Artemisia annua TaxID=35608 RepID=A0A2U1N3K5_ARTAN|nr:protein kinase-like domain, Leucine-rich repeat domain, L domain-like protein [Artemisia annua]